MFILKKLKTKQEPHPMFFIVCNQIWNCAGNLMNVAYS